MPKSSQETKTTQTSFKLDEGAEELTPDLAELTEEEYEPEPYENGFEDYEDLWDM